MKYEPVNPILWQASAKREAESNMSRFMEFCSGELEFSIDNYPDLHKLSIDRPEDFWECVWRFFEIKCYETYKRVLSMGDRMPGAIWFKGARLNFAENLLRHRDDREAIIFRGESGETASYTYRELITEVAKLTQGLLDQGIKKGDRVAALMSNRPETVIAMLATVSIGAIWSSCSPDFGLKGVVDRFGQIEPKFLFAVNGYFYNGKYQDCSEKVEGLLEAIPTILQTVTIACDDNEQSSTQIENSVTYQDFLARYDDCEPTFEAVDFNHPLLILYSSGTTGLPKCIVHSTGGVLLQHLKELGLHTDIKRTDKFFYLTTCGWMMWNWLVSGLGLGATLILYDGSPFKNNVGLLFDLIDELEITVFGVSAKYIEAIEKAGLTPMKTHRLESLKTILSTGSPLAHRSFDYVYKKIKRDVNLASISGGTDIVSCFALGNPMLPVRRGEIQGLGLGLKVEVLNHDGESVVDEKGELTCAAPFPAMPLGFWKDTNNSRFHETYFSKVDGRWCHGDFAEITINGGIIIHGRSDTTLNPGGVRIGTAEIYREVETFSRVLESVAVGQDWKDGERIILFVRMQEGLELDDVLIKAIMNKISSNLTPFHLPEKIISVKDIPRTFSGKIVELAVRQIIHRQGIKNIESICNPESLHYFESLPELSI